MSLLEEIFAHKRAEVVQQRARRPLALAEAEAHAAPPPLDFVAALRRAPARPALIAEIKRASPSRGLLAPQLDPPALARIYVDNGASAISILTDERYFAGHLDHLRLVAGSTPRVPLLRKDFTCDPYQVYEARAAGADAILLIVAGLSRSLLCELHALARDLGMAPLVEVHTAAELETALSCAPALIGINNRNLHDFTTDLSVTLRLAPLAPPGITLVAESGIATPGDLQRLETASRVAGPPGVDAILVGEALVTAPDIAAAVRSLSGYHVGQTAYFALPRMERDEDVGQNAHFVLHQKGSR